MQVKQVGPALIVLVQRSRRPIRFSVDSKGTGRIDMIVLDEDRDGKWDVSYHDTDGDGRIDMIGRHPDGKILASWFEK